MSIDTVIQLGVPFVAIASGWSLGRRGLSRQTIDLLQVQVQTLRESNAAKEQELVELRGRIDTLESMVTQRAAVQEVRDIVDRIAVKVGA